MTDDRRLLWSGLLFGCGIAGAIVDLFVFHLGLQWHHFYDRSTARVALVADGFFHAFIWFITVAGLFWLADVRRRVEVPWRRWTGAVVLGVGLFQLFDGVVNHKVLRIHQIRYDVDLLPYDATWIGAALVLMVLGWLLVRGSGPAVRAPDAMRGR